MYNTADPFSVALVNDYAVSVYVESIYIILVIQIHCRKQYFWFHLYPPCYCTICPVAKTVYAVYNTEMLGFPV